MQILVDADACPVVTIVERMAKEFELPLLIFCDTSHIIDTGYGETIIVSEGADAVDFALLSRTKKGDVVVTQDYGVAALALGKGANAIHQSGRWYTEQKMDAMLYERHMARKARNGKRKVHLKGPKKRTKEDDLRFEESFFKLLRKLIIENTEFDGI